jgi:acylphosphatase
MAVTGFVKNLRDGRVQIVVEGEPAEVQAFLDQVGVEFAYCVRDTQETVGPATGRYSTFEVHF